LIYLIKSVLPIMLTSNQDSFLCVHFLITHFRSKAQNLIFFVLCNAKRKGTYLLCNTSVTQVLNVRTYPFALRNLWTTPRARTESLISFTGINFVAQLKLSSLPCEVMFFTTDFDREELTDKLKLSWKMHIYFVCVNWQRK
jgi:hypothetical protein